MRVAGLGFREAASEASLRAALAAAGGRADALATAAAKAEAPALRALAAALDLPIHAVASDALAAEETSTRSAASLEAHGAGSVAEASALAAARALCGSRARLVGPRAVSPDRMATAAIAMGDPE